MRTIVTETKVYKYDELSQEAKDKAISDFIFDMLQIENAYGYAEHPDFKRSIAEAERLQTPWFQAQIIYDNMKEIFEEDFRLNDYEYTEDGKMF